MSSIHLVGTAAPEVRYYVIRGSGGSVGEGLGLDLTSHFTLRVYLRRALVELTPTGGQGLLTFLKLRRGQGLGSGAGLRLLALLEVRSLRK